MNRNGLGRFVRHAHCQYDGLICVRLIKMDRWLAETTEMLTKAVVRWLASRTSPKPAQTWFQARNRGPGFLFYLEPGNCVPFWGDAAP